MLIDTKLLPTHLKRDKMLQAGMVGSLYKRVFRISNKQAHKSAHPNEQREREWKKNEKRGEKSEIFLKVNHEML